jgi:hypothetical protein
MRANSLLGQVQFPDYFILTKAGIKKPKSYSCLFFTHYKNNRRIEPGVNLTESVINCVHIVRRSHYMRRTKLNKFGQGVGLGKVGHWKSQHFFAPNGTRLTT